MLLKIHLTSGLEEHDCDQFSSAGNVGEPGVSDYVDESLLPYLAAYASVHVRVEYRYPLEQRKDKSGNAC